MAVLEETVAGALRCPQARHAITLWLVVDLDAFEVLGVGARHRVILGPELAGARSMPHYALPKPARRPAA